MIHHISLFKRSDGHRGGVEKFAAHLQVAFPDLQMWALSDFAQARGEPWEKAKALNLWLLQTERIKKDDIVIADGYWGTGLGGKVNLIAVCHGCYVGEAMQHEIHPWADPAVILRHAAAQKHVYMRAQMVVAVSHQAARELERCYDLEARVVLNGVNAGAFRPIPSKRQPQNLILHVASPGRKQSEMVDKVKGLAPGLKIEHLSVHHGGEGIEAARWQQGAVFFQPSLYEGLSYASLESLSCGLPVVGYRTGLWCDVPEGAGGVGEITDDHNEFEYVRLLQHVIGHWKEYRPREWVLQNATVQQFIAKWQEIAQQM